MARRPSLVDEVRDGIMEQLSNGTLSVGDQLPNEQEMGDKFAVSRATIREAYRALVDTGYLARRHGRGTFVARLPGQHSLESTLSYVGMIQNAGFTPGVQVLSHAVRPVHPDEADRLRVDPGATVVEVERVRTADDRPVVYSLDRVPTALLPPEAVADPSGSLFQMLRKNGILLRDGRARLLPIHAPKKIAAILKVPADSPLLWIDETDATAAGLPALLSTEWHVADAFEFWLHRQSGSNDVGA